MPVKDYNADPDLNTQISGINIAEGCAPSGINNAIRQLMADVKEEFEGEEGAVSALDTSLRALIAQEVAKFLKKTGGTMTGAIVANCGTNAIISNVATSGIVRIFGGTSAGTGANLDLYGGDEENGKFVLRARKSDIYKVLEGNVDGTLKWADHAVLTSAGGKTQWLNIVNGAQGGGALYGATKSFYVVSRGTNEKDGAFLRLYSLEDRLDAGNFVLGTHNDDNSWGPVLVGNRDGNLWWNSNRVTTLVASWTDGVSGYRKYNDGYIEQWGRQKGGTVTFPIPFSSTNYCVTMGTIRNERSSNNESAGKLTTTSFYLYTAADTPTCWFAAGY